MALSQGNHDFSAMVNLKGEFDAMGCKEIRRGLEQLIEDYPAGRVALNMRDVTFIDSSGIGAIVFLYKRMLASGGSVTLKGVRNQPGELLRLLRVHEAISVEWDETSLH